MEIKRVLVIPDCHIPYENKKSYELMLAVAKDIDPDGVYILGDYADFYSINAHGKAPHINIKLKDEIYEVHQRLKELSDLFPKAKKVFIEGNHEFRLARYIANKCPDLFDLLTIPELFKLGEYGFDFVPYGPNQQVRVLNSHLFARHEPISGGVHVAHGSVVKAGKSVIFGHTHRIQESQVVSIDGDNYRGISSGWLGDKNHEDGVFNYVKNHHQWAQGFSIVTVLPDGTWFNQLVHIIDNKCVVDGFLYEGD